MNQDIMERDLTSGEEEIEMTDIDRNPAMSFPARDARKATDMAGGETRRVARRMAEAYCERAIMPRIRQVAETGVESTVSIIEPLSAFMKCIWENEPTDGTWSEFDSDRQAWGTDVTDEYPSSYKQPWNWSGNPYSKALEELTRMLTEAGYVAHACMGVRGEPLYANECGMHWTMRVTVSW